MDNEENNTVDSEVEETNTDSVSVESNEGDVFVEENAVIHYQNGNFVVLKNVVGLDLDKIDDVDKIIEKEHVIMNNNMVKVFMDRDDVPELLEKLLKHKYKVYEVRMLRLSLEDAFLEKTGGNVID